MPSPTNPEAEILEAFNRLVDASKALDSTRYLAFIDQERFSGLGADGKVWHSFKNLENIISTGFDMVERIVTLEFSNVKVTVINPSTAILVNEYQQTILLKNKDTVQQSGGGTQVWAKNGNAWKLVSIADASHVGKPAH